MKKFRVKYIYGITVIGWTDGYKVEFDEEDGSTGWLLDMIYLEDDFEERLIKMGYLLDTIRMDYLGQEFVDSVNAYLKKESE